MLILNDPLPRYESCLCCRITPFVVLVRWLPIFRLVLVDAANRVATSRGRILGDAGNSDVHLSLQRLDALGMQAFKSTVEVK